MSEEHPFDVNYYRRLTEEFHDSQIDLAEATTAIYNHFIDVVYDYIQKCSPLTDAETAALATLLTHPKRMVRTSSSVHLMARGYAPAWPTLLAAAAPMFMPDRADKEGWRNFWAAAAAQLYLVRAQRKGKTLGLKPTLLEMEEQWLKEDRPKARLSNKTF